MKLPPVPLTRTESGHYAGPTITVGTHRRPIVITDATPAYDEQYRARVHRYLLLMTIRIPALLVAALLYALTGNPWGAAIILMASIPLPWIAVLIANDRPPVRRRPSRPTLDHPWHTTTRFKSSY